MSGRSVAVRLAGVAVAGALVGACSGGDPRSTSPSVVAGGPSAVPSGASAPSTTDPSSSAGAASPATRAIREFDVRPGTHPHDVYPAADGGVWFTGQRTGVLGHLDPATGTVEEIPLGPGSAPHGVVVGPDGAPWITDGGLNAIVRVDPTTRSVKAFPLPAGRPGASLNSATFDRDGALWFTGQAGVYGRLDPTTGDMRLFDDPNGRGPYGIDATPDGDVWYASLAGSHLGAVDGATGAVRVVEPPTPRAGTRRVWSDSQGRLWASEWDAGQVAVHDPADGSWREWRLPGDRPMAYAVFVDDRDLVWLTDFGANAIVRFDPATERFESIPLAAPDAAVRQFAGRPGEVWGAESGADKLIVVTGG
jgi:virginiamycin B lyase